MDFNDIRKVFEQAVLIDTMVTSDQARYRENADKLVRPAFAAVDCTPECGRLRDAMEEPTVATSKADATEVR